MFVGLNYKKKVGFPTLAKSISVKNYESLLCIRNKCKIKGEIIVNQTVAKVLEK